jgi:hypothetical protein
MTVAYGFVPVYQAVYASPPMLLTPVVMVFPVYPHLSSYYVFRSKWTRVSSAPPHTGEKVVRTHESNFALTYHQFSFHYHVFATLEKGELQPSTAVARNCHRAWDSSSPRAQRVTVALQFPCWNNKCAISLMWMRQSPSIGAQDCDPIGGNTVPLPWGIIQGWI